MAVISARFATQTLISGIHSHYTFSTTSHGVVSVYATATTTTTTTVAGWRDRCWHVTFADSSTVGVMIDLHDSPSSAFGFCRRIVVNLQMDTRHWIADNIWLHIVSEEMSGTNARPEKEDELGTINNTSLNRHLHRDEHRNIITLKEGYIKSDKENYFIILIFFYLFKKAPLNTRWQQVVCLTGYSGRRSV